MKKILPEDSQNRIYTTLTAVIEECKASSEKYDTSGLLAQCKKKGFKQLTELEQEKLMMSLIKVGEALTFCKEETNPLLRDQLITQYAQPFVYVRNHLVHHQIYASNTILLEKKIQDLQPVQSVIDALTALEKLKVTEISKEIKKASNNFNFAYLRYLTSLKHVLTHLSSIMNSLRNESKMLANDPGVEAQLGNAIRTTLAILADLTDDHLINKNEGSKCETEKQTAREHNEEFIKKHPDLIPLFLSVKDYRNALAHPLDPALTQPYSNPHQMIEFADDLKKLHLLQYVETLQLKLKSNQPSQATQFLSSLKNHTSTSSLQSSAVFPHGGHLSDEKNSQPTSASPVVASPLPPHFLVRNKSTGEVKEKAGLKRSAPQEEIVKNSTLKTAESVKEQKKANSLVDYEEDSSDDEAQSNTPRLS